MLNLIDQSDILKGLDDTALQRELAQPSGAVPPFLVLSEISRRKDMRQRYAGELAQAVPKTTVMQDVLAAPSIPPMTAAPAAGGGIAAAVPGFADGGMVDYGDIVKKYQSDLDSITGDRDRDAALALIATGAGIMGAGHSNTLQNIGLGINSGIKNYADALQTTDARETAAIRGLTDIATSQHDEALKRLQMAQDAIPADARAFQYYKSLTPEEQQQYVDLNNPAAAFKADQLATDADRASAIGDAMVNGTSPPTFTGLYHLAPQVRSYIAKEHPDFNLAQAQQDYDATKRLLSSMNGPGQLRLKQAVDFTDESIGKLQQLADAWNGGNFPLLNKANLLAAKQGLKGPEAQALATQLDAQIAEVVSELATVYKGGNSPTDEGLHLAATQFSSDWSKDTFDKLVKQIRDNLQYRKNSLHQLVSGGTGKYMPDTSGMPLTAGSTSDTAPPVPNVPDVPWSVEP